jgi:Tfp pilus assembly protein PilN
MIEINLLPTGIRRGNRKRGLSGGFRIPLEVVIGLGGGLLMLIVVTHVVLLGINLLKVKEFRDLQAQMQDISVAKQEVEALLSDIRATEKTFDDISKVTRQRQILWSPKFNTISDILPRGVWLKRIAFSNGVLNIQGSAISRQSNEIANVHVFTANLKDSGEVFADFDNFELGSIRRRSVGKVEVADFILTAPIKEESE